MQLYIEKLTCISSRHRLLGSIRDRVALDRIERALLGDFELPCQHLQKQNIAINPKLVFNNIVKAFDMSSQFNALQLQQVWKTLLENLFGYNTVHIRHNTVQFVDKDTNRHTTFKATRTVTELLVCDNNQILFSLEVVPDSSSDRNLYLNPNQLYNMSRSTIKVFISDKIYILGKTSNTVLDIGISHDNPMGFDFVSHFICGAFDTDRIENFIRQENYIKLQLQHLVCQRQLAVKRV